MKPWFPLTLVCWVGVCLLLSLSAQADLNHQLQVAGSGQLLDRCGEPAFGSPTAAVVRSMEFHQARAGPLESLVLDCALTASNVDPPCLETHGPPGHRTPWGLGELPVKPATQSKPSSDLSPRNSWPSTHQTEESGFCNSL